MGHGNDTCAWHISFGCINESLPTPDRECLLLRDDKTCINATECVWEPSVPLTGIPRKETELGVCRAARSGPGCGGGCSYLNRTECRQDDQCSWDMTRGCRDRSLALGNGGAAQAGRCWWEVLQRCREKGDEEACTGGEAQGPEGGVLGSDLACVWDDALGCHAVCGHTTAGARCSCPAQEPRGGPAASSAWGSACRFLGRDECLSKPDCGYATATGCRAKPDCDSDGGGGGTAAAPVWKGVTFDDER